MDSFSQVAQGDVEGAGEIYLSEVSVDMTTSLTLQKRKLRYIWFIVKQ